MRNFQETFETCKQSFISAFSNCMAVATFNRTRSMWPEIFDLLINPTILIG